MLSHHAPHTDAADGALHWTQMSIADNLNHLREQIASACRRAGRLSDEVRLMAVSKVHPAEALLEAHAAGQRLFGENRVQEFAGKSEALHEILAAGCDDTEIHLIGPLQSNKTAKAAELFQSIDTVDSFKTAQRLSSAAVALGKKLPILIEVKLSPEDTKHGIAPDLVADLLEEVGPLPSIELRGLMTVPPWSTDAETARPYFRQLRLLRDQLQPAHPTLTELSIGMSNDFAVAIEEGSTTVRIGTALFGRRPPPR